MGNAFDELLAKIEGLTKQANQTNNIEKALALLEAEVNLHEDPKYYIHYTKEDVPLLVDFLSNGGVLAYEGSEESPEGFNLGARGQRPSNEVCRAIFGELTEATRRKTTPAKDYTPVDEQLAKIKEIYPDFDFNNTPIFVEGIKRDLLRVCDGAYIHLGIGATSSIVGDGGDADEAMEDYWNELDRVEVLREFPSERSV